MRCEGWRRYGGAFTFGSVRWKQCENDAVVELTIGQDNEVKTFPACMACWNEAVSTGIKIIEAVPLKAE